VEGEKKRQNRTELTKDAKYRKIKKKKGTEMSFLLQK
jgi:hypothetical protein